MNGERSQRPHWNRRDVLQTGLKGGAAALAAAYGLRPDFATAQVPILVVEQTCNPYPTNCTAATDVVYMGVGFNRGGIQYGAPPTPGSPSRRAASVR